MKTRLTTFVVLAASAAVLAACTSVGVGISVPIPGVGSVQVGGDSSGRVGGGVNVGVGGVSVGVGGSGQVPRRKDGTPEAPATAASAAEPAAPAAPASAPLR
jgi:hypothetical protein